MGTATKKCVNVAVDFGTVSIGDETAGVGIVVDREDMALAQADELFCGRRLVGTIKTAKTSDDPNQKTLDGVEDENRSIKSTFEVKAFSVKSKTITSRLTLALKEIDVSDLGHFAKRSGWLGVQGVFDLENVDADGDDEEDSNDK